MLRISRRLKYDARFSQTTWALWNRAQLLVVVSCVIQGNGVVKHNVTKFYSVQAFINGNVIGFIQTTLQWRHQVIHGYQFGGKYPPRCLRQIILMHFKANRTREILQALC